MIDPIERETAELEANGWKLWNGHSIIWQSPSGALFRGPHGAYVKMKNYPQLSVKAERKPIAIKPEIDTPLA